MRIGVFISGNGSNLQALIDAVKSKNINGEIALVISDNSSAYGLVRAINSNIPSIYIGKENYKNLNDRYNKTLNELNRFNIDMIVLAGYLSILPPIIIKKYKDRIVNIHPSLIPKYCGKGYYGDRVHNEVLECKEEYSGATVHLVDEGIDTGRILVQERVKLQEGETLDSLKEKIHQIEHRILVKAVAELCDSLTYQECEGV